MRRQLLWTRLDQHGLDHCRVVSNADRGGGTRIQGTMLTLCDGDPTTASYEIRADREWRTRSLELTVHGAHTGHLSLVADDPGDWVVEAGDAEAELDGPLDVDTPFTPVTNTLPLRRRDFEVGQTVEVPVVYVSLPDLSVSVAAQRYTRFTADERDAADVYRYEDEGSDLATEIVVDGEGFVVAYPQLFDRVVKMSSA
jgi:hypothetical protein